MNDKETMFDEKSTQYCWHKLKLQYCGSCRMSCSVCGMIRVRSKQGEDVFVRCPLLVEQAKKVCGLEMKHRRCDKNNTCPECGAPVETRTGRHGEFVGCTRYPKCKWTTSIGEWDDADENPGNFRAAEIYPEDEEWGDR